MSKKTTEVIINSGNNYVIGVKKNQPKLYKQISLITRDESEIYGRYSQIELNKGRLERREVLISKNIEGISEEWIGLKEVIKVKRWCKRKGEISVEEAYFISSIETTALTYFEGIRGHWEIENSLHWVKDVTLREDASKIRTNQAPENMSTFRNFALNIFRQNGYKNIAEATRLICNDIRSILKMIT